ncbi:unnamed protein product [Orchesella dallaii]|uniref:Phosphoenolpyruvate synthase n=1 Tax=Orchesella dallaii TaxID=48710 RepID=A0ABP1QFP0_9HEXA
MIFFITAVLAAIILGIKYTTDIFPKPLKLWIIKLALKNWMSSLDQKFGKEANIHPKKFSEIGVLPDEQEVGAERPVPLTSPSIRDDYIIYGTDENGNGISVQLVRHANNKSQANVLISLRDDIYQVSYAGETPNDHEFSLGNLRLEMAEPFRIWRLWYNGIMKHSSKESEKEELVHVVFNFLWKPLASPVDNRKNGNANLLANHLSRNGLFGEDFPNLLKIVPEGYSQFGTLHGNINIHNVQQQLYLYGYRTREAISSKESTMPDIFPILAKRKQRKSSQSGAKAKRLEFFAMCDNGNGFRLNAFNDQWTDGRMLWASYQVTLVKDVDCSASEISRDLSLPKLMNIYDTKGTARVEIWPAFKTLKFSNETQITYLKMTINGRLANGVLIRKSDVVHDNFTAQRSVSQFPYNVVNGSLLLEKVNGPNNSERGGNVDEGQSFLEFSHPACLKVPLVGGKGASLARLQIFTKTQPDDKVKTARGFCISTSLFRQSLDLEKFTDIFNNATSNGQSLEDTCTKIMEMIKSCDAAKRISPLISEWIEKIFGKENRNGIRFAVRSSGVLEDGSDLSCAGQNETFLGVSQLSISQKVVECWASLFTAQSVRYRLNHGQPAVSEMGVVIQEMVDATAAGVIFTADPRTGNPFQMIVTANFGLGESVVSGSSDPDTITLIRHPHSLGKKNECGENETNFHNRLITTTDSKWWDDVTIEEKVMGEKRTKIVCQETKEGIEDSTTEISMTDQESRQFCIDEEIAIKLGIVAAEIELFMGQHKPVDIEWAIDQSGQIFILQCRNLTALDAWTDFELLHELDAPIRVKMDRFTTANIGEVLPKAIHTITQTMNRCLDFNVARQIYLRKGDNSVKPSPYLTTTCMLSQQRLFLNMFHCLYSTADSEISTASVCIDQTIFGRQVIDEEILKTAIERYGVASGGSKLKDFIMQMKIFMTFKSEVEKGSQAYKDFTLDYSNIAARAINVYDKISDDLIHMHHACITHLISTQSSSGSQIFLFLFLSEGKNATEWDTTLYEDASKLLSVFENVESAEMPEDMNKLGNEIVRNGDNFEKFLQASPVNALEWLRENDKMSRALDTFFEKHGHRGIAELDLGEPTWESDPSSFLPILRNVVKNKLNHTEKAKSKVRVAFKNDDELLDSLSSKLKPMTRRLLKLILPTCRNGVMYREKSKSLLVRVIGQLKTSYKYLAKLMVKENLLPSESLIVHLTHYEIGQLVKRDVSSSIILQKAMRRQKMYPFLEKLQFPEINHGMPKELDTSTPVTITNTVHATPVSRGVARGVAKVCLSVEEASENIHPGDILITHGTDIAWSPFFPLLGGVVTELGGLISHGAVVAREYGLPCIVGAVNATKIFKTGDQVILDASKGTISKTED